MCEVLKELYHEVFSEEFSFSREPRIRMQKMVYMMENLGVYVGEYSFVWSDRGPYSIALDDDAYRCSGLPAKKDICFSDSARKGIEKIKDIINANTAYSNTEWLECVASLHYLKYVLRCAGTEEDVILELERRKNWLNNREANGRAMRLANSIELGFWEEAV